MPIQPLLTVPTIIQHQWVRRIQLVLQLKYPIQRSALAALRRSIMDPLTTGAAVNTVLRMLGSSSGTPAFQVARTTTIRLLVTLLGLRGNPLFNYLIILKLCGINMPRNSFLSNLKAQYEIF